jgi:antitoxin HicB
MKKKNIGSSVDSWLREEGIYEEVTATAIKRVLARQVEAAMKEKHFSKAEMARRMHTSRAALDRLLDPDYDAVTLSTLRKAATAVGRRVAARACVGSTSDEPLESSLTVLKTKTWCPGWDLNPHSRCQEKDFKSVASARKRSI